MSLPYESELQSQIPADPDMWPAIEIDIIEEELDYLCNRLTNIKLAEEEVTIIDKRINFLKEVLKAKLDDYKRESQWQ